MPDSFDLELHPPYDSMLKLYGDVAANQLMILEAYAAEGLEPTCRAGCSACCHQLVMTTMAEARATAELIHDLPEAELRRLELSLEGWLSATSDLRRRLQEAADDELEPVVEAIASDYWRKRIPCPFLREGLCAVYEVRPLACRHHFSLSDPELCAANDVENVEGMETMEESFFFAQDAIPEAETEIGMFPELVLLGLRTEQD